MSKVEAPPFGPAAGTAIAAIPASPRAAIPASPRAGRTPRGRNGWLRWAGWLGLAWAAWLSGCRAQDASTAHLPNVTVADTLGRTVRLPAPALRVLSLSPAATEVVFALQRERALVGRTAACDFPPEAAAVPSVGTLFPPDLERLFATAPDLVIMMDGQVELRAAFEARGVPVYVHQPASVAGAVAAVGGLGTLLDAPREARLVQRQMRAALAALPPPVRATTRGLYVVWGAPLTTVGPDTFLNDVLAHAGLANAAADFGAPWPRLSLEQLALVDPSVLVLGAEVDLTAPGWRSLSATRAGRVVRPADADVLVRPGPRLPQGIAALAAAVQALPPPSAAPTPAPTAPAPAPAPTPPAPGPGMGTGAAP